MIAKETDLEIVVLRLPLVYGPGIKANMYRLFAAADRGRPMPLGSVRNSRSLLYVGNLVDVLSRTLEHPAAAGETFLLSDGEDLSTPELVRRIGRALGRPSRLLPIPPWFLRFGGRLLRRSAEVDRLLSSLQLDNGKIRTLLGWSPPFTVEEGLKATAQWFEAQRHEKTL